MQEFRRATPRQGELAAPHHRGGTATGLASYTENISHEFKLFLTVEVNFVFFALAHGAKTGPVETNFFSAQRVVQFEDATDFDAMVADAKLVGSAFNSGGKIEPGLLECMAHAHILDVQIEGEFVPPIVQDDSLSAQLEQSCHEAHLGAPVRAVHGPLLHSIASRQRASFS